MYEDRTYEALVKSALARVPNSIDKREGSMVFNGVAPSMAELAQLYIGLDFVFKATYLLTAPREYLIKRASDRNMAPKPASPAVFRAECNIAVPLGTRFSCEDVNFEVTARMEEYDTPDSFSHAVTCETAGALGNGYTGQLIPVEYMNGLTRAELVELLVPGDDDEETEVFRQRVLDSFQSQAFGGNQADYKEKVLTLKGGAADDCGENKGVKRGTGLDTSGACPPYGYHPQRRELLGARAFHPVPGQHRGAGKDLFRVHGLPPGPGASGQHQRVRPG